MDREHHSFTESGPVGKSIAQHTERIRAREIPSCTQASEDQRAAAWQALFAQEGLDLRNPEVSRGAFLVTVALYDQMAETLAPHEIKPGPEFDVCVSITAAINALARFVS